MLKILKRNKKNILFAVVLTFAFYMLTAPLVYFNNDFQNYLKSKGTVLGIQDSHGENINDVMDEFLQNLESGNFEEIEKTTGLKGRVNFSQWHDLKSVKTVGGWIYEADNVALIRVDFVFWVSDRDFEYPLTLVFVLEKISGQWIVNDVEYTLQRYNEVLE